MVTFTASRGDALLVLVAHALVFGYLAKRFFRWE
jgi:hypothetical protein